MAVQGHPRSLILVPTESAYATTEFSYRSRTNVCVCVCGLRREGTFTTATNRFSVLSAPSRSASLALWLFTGPHTSTSCESDRRPIRYWWMPQFCSIYGSSRLSNIDLFTPRLKVCTCHSVNTQLLPSDAHSHGSHDQLHTSGGYRGDGGHATNCICIRIFLSA